MIGSLRGDLLDRADDELLVEVSGIGYRVSITTDVRTQRLSTASPRSRSAGCSRP